MKRMGTALLFASMVAAAAAQSNIDPSHRFAWSENTGWSNWHDANGAAEGANVGATFLSGFVWSESVGYICMGDGVPAGGVAYANVNGTDFGVNVSAGSGILSGFAWGENIGWINFAGGALATPPGAAFLDRHAGRLRGYAWGENIGWINLDDATRYVGVLRCGSCPGDLDHDCDVSLQDLTILLANFGVLSGATPDEGDLDADGDVALQDLTILLANFGTTCP